MFKPHQCVASAMRAATLVLLTPLLLIPSGAAAPIFLGTEDLPEIPDASGDVEYDPKYVGNKDHDYIDFLAGWFTYDNQTDEIGVTFKTGSGAQLGTASRDWTIGCSMGGNTTTDGVLQGRISFSWTLPPGAAEMRHAIVFTPGERDGVGTATARTLDHQFNAVLEEPGYYSFRLPHASLMLLGDEIQDLTAGCLEYLATPPPFIFPAIINRDGASSGATYSFADNARARTSGGELEQDSEFPAGSKPIVAQGNEPNDTPAPGFLAGLLAAGTALLVGMVAVRRRA